MPSSTSIPCWVSARWLWTYRSPLPKSTVRSTTHQAIPSSPGTTTSTGRLLASWITHSLTPTPTTALPLASLIGVPMRYKVRIFSEFTAQLPIHTCKPPNIIQIGVGLIGNSADELYQDLYANFQPVILNNNLNQVGGACAIPEPPNQSATEDHGYTYYCFIWFVGLTEIISDSTCACFAEGCCAPGYGL